MPIAPPHHRATGPGKTVTLQVLVFLFDEAHLLFNNTDEVRTAGTKKPARDPDGLLLSASITE
ncbi:MAG: hypothetical protein ACRCTP_14505 [Aeromonas popoffii]|uniref:hypothetical protein n=1 Tax=Aeromonas popoffii TaxID=70856 RepID=UPI003F2EB733